MISFTRICILLIVFVLLTFTVRADGILFTWNAKDITGMTEELFNASQKWQTPEIISRIKTATEWSELYLLIMASKKYKDESIFIDTLISLISDSSQRRLTMTSHLIIWERITSGDIFFDGRGVQISDDLFKVAGRANWILRNLTRKNFGAVKIHDNTGKLSLLKSKWMAWRQGEDIAEYKDPYITKSKGLQEIKSLEALEAIITSLKHTPEKERFTKDCLMKTYKLTELPSDPNAPATFCSPDTFANMYLSELTGITTKQSFDWWNNWWLENNDKLIWNTETGKFDIHP